MKPIFAFAFLLFFTAGNNKSISDDPVTDSVNPADMVVVKKFFSAI